MREAVGAGGTPITAAPGYATRDVEGVVEGPGGCPIEDMVNPSYLTGGDNFAEFIMQDASMSAASRLASATNCKVVECGEGGSVIVKSLEVKKSAHLFVQQLDLSWARRHLSVTAGSSLLLTTGAIDTPAQIIDLLGCRANPAPPPPAPPPHDAKGKMSFLASNCLVLNCTSDFDSTVICESGAAGGVAARKKRDAWMAALNRHSHGTHTIGRYEVNVKVTITPHVDYMKAKEVYNQQAWREAWMLSFLQQLPQVGASPHFPLIYAAYRCDNMPEQFVDAPGMDMGILPAETQGGKAMRTNLQAKREGGKKKTNYAITHLEAHSVTLESIVRAFKDWAMSATFVRGVIFQLLHALGVARRHFGFHHNDLLTLPSIRFTQLPTKTVDSRPYWCYSLNDAAFEDADDMYAIPDLTPIVNATNTTKLRSLDELYNILDLIPPHDACRAQSTPSLARNSWCLRAEDVDGLQLKLYNMGAAALARPQLLAWRRGWTFLNTACARPVHATSPVVRSISPRHPHPHSP